MRFHIFINKVYSIPVIDHICMCVYHFLCEYNKLHYIYIYIYIYRERERERERVMKRTLA